LAYDFDQVLLAAKNLENVDGIEFVLQGGGELAGYLKARAKGLKLNNVKIIDRIVSRDRAAKLLSEADALILPLRDFGAPYLGISSKLYEYQAVGKPIICCSIGQPADYVKETKSGKVIKPGDHESLTKVVQYLKDNPETAKALGENGRKHVEATCSCEKIGLLMQSVFESLISPEVD